MLKPRNTISSLPAYHPPLAGRRGLRLDFNENTVGCSPNVMQRLQQLTVEDLAAYPEREPLEKLVADFLGVKPSELLLTNGVDEAIHLLCQTYLEAGDEALIVVPTYSMYRIYIMASGGKLVSIPAEKGFQFPTETVLKRMSPNIRFIVVANPNNPTGTVVPKGDLLRIAQAAPEAALLIDEAYFEFYGDTALPNHRDSPNLFVARTFSKAYGLAGLRVGVLVGNSNQMEAIHRVCSPYNVNAVALACLPQAIADQAYIQSYVAQVLDSRSRLEEALRTHGIESWPSQANFILLRAGATKDAAAAFAEKMRQRGILVRDRSNDYGCEGCIRITLGTAEHTDRLLKALVENVGELTSSLGVPR